MFAGIERPVDLVAVDAGAVEDHEGAPGPLSVPQRIADAWSAGGQADGLAGAPPHGRGRDAEAGREVGQPLAFVRVREGEQGLLSGVEQPPVRADTAPVARIRAEVRRRVVVDNGSAAW
ncbi:hypothetical protein GCM10027447_26220 [Glycomyces halotolerans]